jgi:UPF0755 protein
VVGLKKLLKFFLWLVFFSLILGSGAGFYAWREAGRFLNTPASAVLGQEPHFFYLVVEPGSSFERVVNQLAEAGGISNTHYFNLFGRWKKATGSIKAGEFEFNTGWTPEQVLDQLVSGRSLQHRVTIPEGLPWWEVGRILHERGFVKFEDFEDASPQLCRQTK